MASKANDELTPTPPTTAHRLAPSTSTSIEPIFLELLFKKKRRKKNVINIKIVCIYRCLIMRPFPGTILPFSQEKEICFTSDVLFLSECIYVYHEDRKE